MAPHWHEAAEGLNLPFYIRRMNTVGYVRAGEIPPARLPLVGFIYVTSGEVLVESEGSPYLCQPGHILLIPQQCPFSVRYYRDAVGYTGGIAPSSLSDLQALRYLSAPLQQAFWFDEGVFVGELFNMLEISFRKNDDVFVQKGLSLLLSRIKPDRRSTIPTVVAAFLEAVFDTDRVPRTLSDYAEELAISENYLSRLVKRYTFRSVGAWIDTVRIQRSKQLLATTAMPIIDVSVAVGVDDQSYFARLFKKETGMTPSAFRKKMQGLS